MKTTIATRTGFITKKKQHMRWWLHKPPQKGRQSAKKVQLCMCLTVTQSLLRMEEQQTDVLSENLGKETQKAEVRDALRSGC